MRSSTFIRYSSHAHLLGTGGHLDNFVFKIQIGLAKPVRSRPDHYNLVRRMSVYISRARALRVHAYLVLLASR